MNKKIIFTEHQINQIIELYKNKQNCRKIAKNFGVSFNIINNLINKLGLPRMSGDTRIPPELEKEIVDLYLKHKLSSVVISEKFNISKQCVLRCLKRNNIDRREPTRTVTPKVNKDDLINLYINRKLTLKEIAIKFNVVTNTIKRWLVFYSIPLKNEKISKYLIRTLTIKYVRSKLCQWKNDIKQRDGYACKKCGRKDSLEVHHVIPLSTIVREFLKTYEYLDFSLKENFDFLIDAIIKQHNPDTGITLCGLCHSSIDNARKNIFQKKHNA